MDKPKTSCPNCGGKTWTLQLPTQGTLSIENVEDGSADISFKFGHLYHVYVCKNCKYSMFFHISPNAGR